MQDEPVGCFGVYWHGFHEILWVIMEKYVLTLLGEFTSHTRAELISVDIDHPFSPSFPRESN
jgi:hypothetical protein